MFKQSLPYIIALVIIIVLFSFFGGSLLKKTNEENKLLSENVSKLEKIYSSDNLPSSELINAMEENNAQLEQAYEDLKAKLPTYKRTSIPQDVNSSLFFLEELKNSKDRIRAKASKKGTQIFSEDLGLPSILPLESEAPQLIRSLYLTETVIDLLLEVGIISIDSVMLGQKTNKGAYEDIPLIISLRCDMPSLPKLLFALENNKEGFFITRGFSLVSVVVSRETSMSSDTSSDYRSRVTSASYARGTTSRTTEMEKFIQINLNLSIIRWQ